MAKAKNAPVKTGKDSKKGKSKNKKQNPRGNFFNRSIHFFKEVISELKKVTWPTRKTLISYTLAVIVFVIIAMAIVFLLDTAATQIFSKWLQ